MLRKKKGKIYASFQNSNCAALVLFLPPPFYCSLGVFLYKYQNDFSTPTDSKQHLLKLYFMIWKGLGQVTLLLHVASSHMCYSLV